MKNFMLCLVLAMAALEVFALYYAYEVLNHGTGGMAVFSALLAIVVPAIGLVATFSSYRRVRDRPPVI